MSLQNQILATPGWCKLNVETLLVGCETTVERPTSEGGSYAFGLFGTLHMVLRFVLGVAATRSSSLASKPVQKNMSRSLFGGPRNSEAMDPSALQLSNAFTWAQKNGKNHPTPALCCPKDARSRPNVFSSALHRGIARLWKPFSCMESQRS